jgi:hypothetical protein
MKKLLSIVCLFVLCVFFADAHIASAKMPTARPTIPPVELSTVKDASLNVYVNSLLKALQKNGINANISIEQDASMGGGLGAKDCDCTVCEANSRGKVKCHCASGAECDDDSDQFGSGNQLPEMQSE